MNWGKGMDAFQRDQPSLNGMNWGIYIQRFPPTVERVAEIPDDFQPAPLGMRADLIDRILELVPGADFSNPQHGIFDGTGYSIEFSMGSKEVCTGITLLVRGGGNPIPLIAALLDRLQLQAVDWQTREILDVEAALASSGSWQRYRDQIERPEG